LSLIVAGNFVLTGKFFLSKSGSVFLFARLMQDGIVQRLMNETCPPAGTIAWRLCDYKNKLPKSANAWLWGSHSGFRAMGGFTSQRQQEEAGRIIVESLKRYPMMNLRAAASDSLLQFLQFKTGDGIEPQLPILEPSFKRMIPRQLPAYLEGAPAAGSDPVQDLEPRPCAGGCHVGPWGYCCCSSAPFWAAPGIAPVFRPWCCWA
jgi:hypothetical protein